MANRPDPASYNPALACRARKPKSSHSLSLDVRSWRQRIADARFHFDAFSSCEPVATSLESKAPFIAKNRIRYMGHLSGRSFRQNGWSGIVLNVKHYGIKHDASSAIIPFDFDAVCIAGNDSSRACSGFARKYANLLSGFQGFGLFFVQGESPLAILDDASPVRVADWIPPLESSRCRVPRQLASVRARPRLRSAFHHCRW